MLDRHKTVILGWVFVIATLIALLSFLTYRNEKPEDYCMPVALAERICTPTVSALQYYTLKDGKSAVLQYDVLDCKSKPWYSDIALNEAHACKPFAEGYMFTKTPSIHLIAFAWTVGNVSAVVAAVVAIIWIYLVKQQNVEDTA